MRLKIEFFMNNNQSFTAYCNHANFSDDYKKIRGFVPISPNSWFSVKT